MIKVRLFLFSLLSLAFLPTMAQVEINETNFPDDVFRNYISTTFDDDNSGTLSSDEISGVTDIDVHRTFNWNTMAYSGDAITSLEGVEIFTNLNTLNFSGQEVVEFEASLPNLTTLTCYDNKLTSLIVGNMPKLENLYCENLFLDNANQLQEIDISALEELDDFNCGGNLIESLDVSQNTKLRLLSCYNCKLTALDVTHNPLLEDLTAEFNSIEEIDLSNNAALDNLDIAYNKIRTIDISNNPVLRGVGVLGNQLTSLDVPRTPTSESDYNLVSTQNQALTLDVYADASNNLYLKVPKGISASKMTDFTYPGTTSSTYSITENTDDSYIVFKEGVDSRYALFDIDGSNYNAQTIKYNYANTVYTCQNNSAYINDDGTPEEITNNMDVTISIKAYALPINTNGYSTLCLPFATTIPDGATAYAVSSVDNSAKVVNLTAITGGVLPANTPAVIGDTGGSVAVFNATDETGTAPTTNLLQGTTSDISVSGIYTLGTSIENSTLYGFFQYTGTTLHAYRAYLPADVASGAKEFTLHFNDDAVTGINEIDNVKTADETWYSIDGKRLPSKPTASGLYIHNGKKVIISQAK